MVEEIFGASIAPLVALLTLLISLVLTGCASPAAWSPSERQSPDGTRAEWNVVVIGDSSLWGLGEAIAAQIEDDMDVTVAVYDATVGGLSAGEVLRALRTGDAESPRLKRLPEQLEKAQVVVMWVNPTDSIAPDRPMNAGACLGSRDPGPCPPEAFEKYTADLEAIWAEILDLRAGRPTILWATDLYNPLVVPWREHGVFEACTLCWENLSGAVRAAADAFNIPFLSRYDAFNGPNHDEDPREKGYIRSDGEHPTELASEYTAKLLADIGYAPVIPP